jgi:Reversibly glycosylated polypeptide
VVVVIPSNRSVSLDYLTPLIDAGARFVVVDDSRGSLSIRHPQFEVYTWEDQERLLGPDAIAIPRGNGACRDFGFYVAWRDSDPSEVIVALDDDCRVDLSDFATRAAESLCVAMRPMARGNGMHFNILDLYAGGPDDLYPRGFPYSCRPGYQRFRFDEISEVAPVFHLGLWKGVFDVNAIDKLTGPPFVHEEATLQHESVTVPSGQLVSVCSMNMIFRREVIPAVYQLPMQVEVMPGWVIDRYGDIWGGFVLKKVLDHLGEAMTVGAPMIRHLKEGDIRRNIWQEHTCHLVNDEFLAILDRVELSGTDLLGVVEQVVDGFDAATADASPILAPYLSCLTPAWRAWVSVLRRAG